MKEPSQHGSPAADDARIVGGSVDVGAVQLARVYARAIVEAADSRECRREVLTELRTIVGEVLPKVPRAADVFASPQVPANEKEEMLSRLFGGRITPTTLHSLQVLARHGRLGILPEVVTAVAELSDRLDGRRQATFTTALPLDVAEQGTVIQSFEKALGVSLAPTFVVDPKVLGGLVARVGDTVYDHSVATSLLRLGDNLKQRSIHEIQHRRDRLGTA